MAILMAILAGGPALAMDITTCGQFVPAGESAVLTTDLACARTTTWPFSAQGVTLDGGASVHLSGHSITGDGGGVGVTCNPQSVRARREPCRVTGPGTVSGFELGIGGVGLVEVTLAPDSPVVDHAIKDLEIPRDATIVAVVRSEHVVMPRGDTIFEAGDEVLAMVTPESEDEVRRILTGG